jgi:hypothetical protein
MFSRTDRNASISMSRTLAISSRIFTPVEIPSFEIRTSESRIITQLDWNVAVIMR